MPDKITIVKESGESITSNVMSVFMIPETNKQYIITTENAVDPHGLTVLHVSEINDNNLIKVQTDDEWSSIKTIMRAIISSNLGSYKYIPLINNVNAKDVYSRDISVSAGAAKQLLESYTNSPKEVPIKEDTELDINANDIESNSIFPTENVETDENAEIAPGIAEVEQPAAEPTTDISSLEDAIADNQVVDVPIIDNNQIVEQPVEEQPVSEEPVATEETPGPETVTDSIPEIPSSEAVPIEGTVPVDIPVIGDVPEGVDIPIAGVTGEENTEGTEEVVPAGEEITPVGTEEVVPTDEEIAPVGTEEVVPEGEEIAPVGTEEVVPEGEEIAPVGTEEVVPAGEEITPVGTEEISNEEEPADESEGESSGGSAVAIPENAVISANVDSEAIKEALTEIVGDRIENTLTDKVTELLPSTIQDNMAPAIEQTLPEIIDTNIKEPIEKKVEETLNSLIDEKIQTPLIETVTNTVNETIERQSKALSSVGIKLDFGVESSFGQKATLDEIVAGAQELFIEGVKNLIMVMTERVYKELRIKEEDLKKREVIVSQREQAVNDKTMAMMNGTYNPADYQTPIVMTQPVMQQSVVPTAPVMPVQQPAPVTPVVEQPVSEPTTPVAETTAPVTVPVAEPASTETPAPEAVVEEPAAPVEPTIPVVEQPTAEPTAPVEETAAPLPVAVAEPAPPEPAPAEAPVTDPAAPVTQ